MTRKQEVEQWAAEAKTNGAKALIIVCDTFDHENYPVEVMPDDDLKELKDKYSSNMQRIMEVIVFHAVESDRPES